jgi:heme oxygenase
MDKKLLNNSKLFEKIEIDWFSFDDLKNRKKEFRNFYQEIVDKFILQKDQITEFIKSKNSKK